MNTAIISDPAYRKHITGRKHPETPLRFQVIVDALSAHSLLTPHNHLPPRPASLEEILLCHTADYFTLLQKEIALCPEKGTVALSTGDAIICPDSLQVALLAAGAVLTAVDAVMERKAKNAFCVVRPPGHHATSTQGMGFCLLNNVAIGARYVQKKYGLKKVAIIDWDVHHGNGTQEIFESDPSVFYFSTHQYPAYPGTGKASERGKGAGEGYTLNYPIEASISSRKELFVAFREGLVPAMKQFQPEFIFISSGFDAHVTDPLGGFNLLTEDFAELTRIVMEIAHAYAHDHIVSVLEGGYNLETLGEIAVAHVQALSQ